MLAAASVFEEPNQFLFAFSNADAWSSFAVAHHLVATYRSIKPLIIPRHTSVYSSGIYEAREDGVL